MYKKGPSEKLSQKNAREPRIKLNPSELVDRVVLGYLRRL